MNLVSRSFTLTTALPFFTSSLQGRKHVLKDEGATSFPISSLLFLFLLPFPFSSPPLLLSLSSSYPCPFHFLPLPILFSRPSLPLPIDLGAMVVLVGQRFGVGLVIERSLVRLPAGALSSHLGQLSLPSLRGR